MTDSRYKSDSALFDPNEIAQHLRAFYPSIPSERYPQVLCIIPGDYKSQLEYIVRTTLSDSSEDNGTKLYWLQYALDQGVFKSSNTVKNSKALPLIEFVLNQSSTLEDFIDWTDMSIVNEIIPFNMHETIFSSHAKRFQVDNAQTRKQLFRFFISHSNDCAEAMGYTHKGIADHWLTYENENALYMNYISYYLAKETNSMVGEALEKRNVIEPEVSENSRIYRRKIV